MALFDAVKATRVLLVGELNPYGAQEWAALYPYPERASGAHLRRVMGLPVPVYKRLGRANLCVGKWSTPAAVARASELISIFTKASVELTAANECVPRRDVPVAVVLLGAKVRDIFRGPEAFSVRYDVAGIRFIGLPHPSGRCREWNEPNVVARARLALGEAAPWIPWGCFEG